MKKNLVALLLVLAVVSVGLFAGPTVNFNVVTNVPAIGEIKITDGQFAPEPVRRNSLSTITPTFTGTHTVSQAGAQNLGKYISVLSNNRAGFTIEMSATAMKSGNLGDGYYDYINYTVAAGGASIETEDETVKPAQVVYETPAKLTGLSFYSTLITLTVDEDSFHDALAGEGYQGTVTFEYFTK